MLRRYSLQPVPSELRATHTDELRPATSTPKTSTTDTADVQNPTMGAEVKQSGSGRAFIAPGLTFPVQSPTPEPDRRRIARPMPSTARDQTEVVRPPGLSQ